MTRLGDVTKGILIFICGYYVLVMIANAAMGQHALALLMLIGIIIPFLYIAYQHAKDRKSQKTNQPAS